MYSYSFKIWPSSLSKSRTLLSKVEAKIHILSPENRTDVIGSKNKESLREIHFIKHFNQYNFQFHISVGKVAISYVN